MITINDIRLTVQAYIPYDSGYMYMHGTRFSETPTMFSVIYDGNSVPYIPYQEYGFTHWLSGQRVEVNMHFIQDDTTNALDYLINQASSGDQQRLLAFSKRKVQARNSQLSQGVLETAKGNMNRSGRGVLIGQ